MIRRDIAQLVEKVKVIVGVSESARDN